MGDAAILVELHSLGAAMALFQQACRDRLDGIQGLVPAARTVLVRFDPQQKSVDAVKAWVQACALRLPAPWREGDDTGGDSADSVPGRGQARQGVDIVADASAPRVEIPVRYDGEDLESLARTLGMTRSALIARHTGTDFVAAFAGFAPGFVYLAGGDPCFAHVTRRAVPRTRVPAGSVALAGGFGAVYPSESPGGWQLLGHTPLRLWDLDRANPALIQPGCRVRFVEMPPDASAGEGVSSARAHCGHEGEATDAARESALARPLGAARSRQETGAFLEVRHAGLQTVLQDAGRPGFAHLGVSGSGALDPAAMHAANRLVGNAPDTVVLENVLGNLTLVCHGRAVLAVTGACAGVVVTTASGMRVPAASHAALSLDEGYCLRIGPVRAGVRCYLAVRGGWDVAPVLGSRSTDLLSGIGPAPIRSGDALHVSSVAALATGPGEHPVLPVDAALAPVRAGEEVILNVVLGPRLDWFDAACADRLLAQAWRVTPDCNRIGMRLQGGQPLVRRDTAELPSEGVVPGAIQVPAGGQPLVFLADHPITGGYPVIAVVTQRDVGRLAQVPVGARLRFQVADS